MRIQLESLYDRHIINVVFLTIPNNGRVVLLGLMRMRISSLMSIFN